MSQSRHFERRNEATSSQLMITETWAHPRRKENLHQMEFHFLRLSTKQVSDSERETAAEYNELADN
jgi:hypothetical protein